MHTYFYSHLCIMKIYNDNIQKKRNGQCFETFQINLFLLRFPVFQENRYLYAKYLLIANL